MQADRQTDRQTDRQQANRQTKLKSKKTNKKKHSLHVNLELEDANDGHHRKPSVCRLGRSFVFSSPALADLLISKVVELLLRRKWLLRESLSSAHHRPKMKSLLCMWRAAPMQREWMPCCHDRITSRQMLGMLALEMQRSFGEAEAEAAKKKTLN